MSWLHLVLLEGLPHYHVMTVHVSSAAGSMVFFVSSILLASRKFSLLHCLPSTGQDWLWSGLTHLGGLVHFLVQKGTKRPIQACRNYSFAYIVMYYSSSVVSRSFLSECVKRHSLGTQHGFSDPRASWDHLHQLEEHKRHLDSLSLGGVLEREELWRQTGLASKPSSPAY